MSEDIWNSIKQFNFPPDFKIVICSSAFWEQRGQMVSFKVAIGWDSFDRTDVLNFRKTFRKPEKKVWMSYGS